MSRRASVSAVRKNLTAAEEFLRKKQEAKVFELGVPATPEYLWNDRPLYALWKKNAAMLFGKRRLSFADGEALLALCKAELLGDLTAMSAIFIATWKSRAPFPDPNPVATHTLDAFLKGVRRERETFATRMQPDATVCLGAGLKPYAWPEGDAATVARNYASEVVAGKIPSCELLRRAAMRFISDLEDGHLRGLYFDPAAAANVVQFAKMFCGLENIMGWQIFVLANLFGWKRATGYRRYSEAWLSMGRKNGKTRFAACVGLFMLIADQEQYPEVLAAATAKDQSRIVWKDARRCIGDNAELRDHVKRWAGDLAVPDTDGSFKALASEERSFLGTRPSGAIADEVAVWSDRLAWDTLIQGMVSRTQPLILAITTAGETKQSFGFEKFAWAEKILRGIVQADHVFVAIYSIDKEDSYKDLAALAKANPSLGVTLHEEHLKTQIQGIEENPSALNNFLRFHANIYPETTLNRAGSITAAKWDACAGLELVGCKTPMDACVKFLQMNQDMPCFVGVDIGLTGDLTAVAMLWPRVRLEAGAEPIEKKVVIVQGFLPEVGMLDKEKLWGVPLSTWAREEFLDLMPGDMCDPKLVKDYVLQLHQQYSVREIGFDPWQFSVAAADLNAAGISAIAVPQTAMHLTAPCRELLSAVHSGALVHFGNPYFAWNATNVVLVENEKHGGCKPDKLSPKDKIDAVSALVNAWARMLANPVLPNPYDKRGVIFL